MIEYIGNMVAFLPLSENQALEILKLVPKSDRQHRQLVAELLSM